MAKSKLFAGIFIGTLLGSMYGMLFAPKKGTALRKELQDAHAKGDKVYQVLAKELGMVGKESVEVVKEMFESEDFQKFLKMSKAKIDELAETAAQKGGEYTEEMQKKLEYLAHMAQKKASEMTKQAKKTTQQAGKKASKVVHKAASDFKKNVKSI